MNEIKKKEQINEWIKERNKEKNEWMKRKMTMIKIMNE